MAVNCAIIFYTSNSLQIILAPYDLPILYQFMVIVAIEHGVIAYKYFYSLLVKDIPTWVERE